MGMSEFPNRDDSKQAACARLRRMRLIATLLLVGMGGVFILSCLGRTRWEWLHWPQAFAEAALVGGLADWFAVVAIFRHPLGLRIPHTAVLRARKPEIAKAIATFVVENFLARGVVASRLARVDLARLMGTWLEVEAAFFAGGICKAVPQVLASLNSSDMTALIQSRLQKHFEALPLAPLAGRLLGVLTAGGRHEVLLDEALLLAERLLYQHRNALEESIRSEVPLPDYILIPMLSLEQVKDSIASWVAEKLVTRMQEFLAAASRNRTHPVRAEFTARVNRLVVELQESPEYLLKGEELKRELLSNAALREYAEGIWGEIRAAFEKAADAGEQGALHRAVVGAIGAFAETLRASGGAASGLNTGLREWVGTLVESQRHAAAAFIEETVAGWDPEEMSRKIEEEVGADLQFVRINGTIIGGLAGLLIHALGLLAR
jgi:uncharacterized membrane-anchored protein YjiN (DUF445 family)